MDFNNLSEEVGGNGRYQRFILLFVLLPAQLPYLCQMYCHLFMSINPDHWCKISLLEKWNVTDNFSRHLFVPKKDNILYSLQYEQCFAYNISYKTLILHSTLVGWIPNQSWPITKCTEGWVYNRTLLGEDNSIITKWDLVCDQEFKQVVPIVLFFLGNSFGLIFGFKFSDKYGKKRTYFLMLGFHCLFGTITAFVNRFELFYILRLAMGFTIASIGSIPKSVSLELAKNGSKANVLLESGYCQNFGALLLVLISFMVRDFQHLTIAISFPFIVFLFYFWLFPESPKWLILNEKIDKMDQLIQNIASTNVKLLSPDYSISLRRRIRIECALQTEIKAKRDNSFPIKLLFSTKIRTEAITLCLLNISHSVIDIGFTYYVIGFSENKGNGDIYFPFLVAIISNLMGIFIARITLCRFGRKYTVIFGDILSALFALMSAFVMNKDLNLCLIYFSSAKVFQSTSLYCLIVWSHELKTISDNYSISNLCEILSNFSLVSVPLIIYQFNKKEYTIYNGIKLSMCLSSFAMTLMVSAILSFTLPDTNNQQNKSYELNGNFDQQNQVNRSEAHQIHKTKNGILKNKGPQPQSPIISLLRRQDMIRNRESDMDMIKNGDKKTTNDICTIKVTVL